MLERDDMSVIIVLGLLWAILLVPPLVRGHLLRRAEFADSFHARLGTLTATPTTPVPGTPVPGPGPRASALRPPSAARRRRIVLLALVAPAVVALAVGSALSLREAWASGLFLTNATLLYLCLLARGRERGRVGGEARRRVRERPPSLRVRSPGLAARA